MLDKYPVPPETLKNNMPSHPKSRGANKEKELLEFRLRAAFEADPLEDGKNHPADRIIEKALQSKNQHVLEWLRDLCIDDAEYPGFAALVLCCVGRQPSPGTSSWRARLVRYGLAKDDVEIRDAAVQAAESWGGREILNVLESHQEPELWIQDYIRDVVNDLRE